MEINMNGLFWRTNWSNLLQKGTFGLNLKKLGQNLGLLESGRIYNNVTFLKPHLKCVLEIGYNVTPYNVYFSLWVVVKTNSVIKSRWLATAEVLLTTHYNRSKKTPSSAPLPGNPSADVNHKYASLMDFLRSLVICFD